eukprot:scaffold100669_cov16-Tisochrysis_lutea.AAC.3
MAGISQTNQDSSQTRMALSQVCQDDKQQPANQVRMAGIGQVSEALLAKRKVRPVTYFRSSL